MLVIGPMHGGCWNILDQRRFTRTEEPADYGEWHSFLIIVGTWKGRRSFCINERPITSSTRIRNDEQSTYGISSSSMVDGLSRNRDPCNEFAMMSSGRISGR